RGAPYRFILFCDDLSFEAEDTSYKSLKAVLEGGIEGRPENVVLYATSNRRHLMARDMMENERATAINPGEAVEEKVSLSARFGPWLCLPRGQPGRVLGQGPRLGEPLPHPLRRRRARARGARMGNYAGRALGPCRLAIRAGFGRSAAGPTVGAYEPANEGWRWLALSHGVRLTRQRAAASGRAASDLCAPRSATVGYRHCRFGRTCR